MFKTILDFLNASVTGGHSHMLITLIILAGIAACSVVAFYVCRILLRILNYFIEKSPTKWDDDLLDKRFLRGVSQLAPAMLVNWMLPGFFNNGEQGIHWIKVVTLLYILATVVYIINIFIGNLYRAFSRRPSMHAYAVKGVFQMVRLLVTGLGLIVALSIIINKSPMVIITALGASAVLLMLVFRDTILGLVASVQLTANKMLHRGDWIVAPGHRANGEVVDVSLTTVKVRNWDNSITTIPPYSLVKDSFCNYQPMRKSGGRRIKRAIYLDFNTIRFCTPDELEQLAAQGWLEGISIEDAQRQVNLSLLRRYLEQYLSNHPEVKTDMLLMIRQLDPTQAGLPLELYFFTTQTEWKAFEKVQSEIFDHVYAVINQFGLRIFQTPAGTDLSRIDPDRNPTSQDIL